jgi:hypothetical protein
LKVILELLEDCFAGIYFLIFLTRCLPNYANVLRMCLGLDALPITGSGFTVTWPGRKI